ncbi:hypothetical protein GCM10007301_00750 [Azorhizobium oxalatiphilum]|uniref:DUF1236 domain-containing protein n=1 Tax=Azorhizobium oxalatiphilum TaxID=980631 RepID=A0A917BJL0_9HYPH|nr:DUF1236 domain-containing protein [Azorhizobium oxalatiphilum]GGF45093.1 hypothetical protein GCM10007301_00750 [Azorhizobium oxalatiphilum]
MSQHFRRPLMGAALLAALVGTTAAASAQTAVIVTQPQVVTPQTVVTTPDRYVLVTPEQNTYIQRYVVENPAPRTSFSSSSYRPAVGTELPAGVAVQTFQPGSYGGFEAQRYGYILTDTDQTVLVDPGTRRVIQVLP